MTREILICIQVGVSWVSEEYFTSIARVLQGISRVFLEGFKCICVVLQGSFRMFFVKKGILLCTEVISVTHANSIGKKEPKNTLGTSITYPRITLKQSWNHLEVSLKHPRNSPKTPMNRPKNTQTNIDIYFRCNNDGHL